ncbi:MAG TPA: sigma-70 family RNA polymerase sigma factor [Verrucomicrobiae bacterium]|nr:sigma-70 family RNA polymerase sigma factor [Verrucomicrobiae bacterium]
MAHPADELIPTRATLIHRLKNWQDQSSWQDFFDTYWNLIYTVALKRGLNPAEAEDVVQETLISVAKHMPTFKYDPTIGSFKGWLLNMTRWRIADQYRKRNYLSGSDDLDESDTGGMKVDKLAEWLAPDLEKIWESEWENNLLKAALTSARRRLDPAHYQIYDFYVNKGWPPEKVADAFSIPIGQVYTAKCRVTEVIRQEIERLGQEMI